MSDMKQLAEAVRDRVARRAQSTMSSEYIENVANILLEAAASLREDLNRRAPVFQLPAEILQQILAQVPGPLAEDNDNIRPFWHSSATDTSMLTPILETCRQLRRIALSHKALWKTVSPAHQYGLPSVLLREHCNIPLVVILDGTLGIGPLGNLDEVDISRIRELHVLNLRRLQSRDDISEIGEYLRSGLPLLESLFISHVFVKIGEACPFSFADAPRLRHMMLQSVTFIPPNAFPHLTHLSLSDVYVPQCHMDTAHLLSRCPNLESLAIRYPLMSADMSFPNPLPQPLPFNHLCRVALQLPPNYDSILEFYISVFPLHDWNHRPIAWQILGLSITDDTVSRLGQPLFQVTRGEASHLSVLLRPHPRGGGRQSISITAAGPKGTFHASTGSIRDVDMEEEEEEEEEVELPEMFLRAILNDYAQLRTVREFWMTGLSPQREGYGLAGYFSIITALVALETVVFVVASEESELRELEVDLGVCPIIHLPGFTAHKLKTLRIVCGNEATTEEEGGSVTKIRLTKLLDQVGTGAYGYFEQILLQVTRELTVDEKDLAQLRAYFATVRIEYTDSIPTMPLPEYCTEPYAGTNGSSTWHGSIW